MGSFRSRTFGAVALTWIAFSSGAIATTGDPLPDVDVSLDRKPGGFLKQVKPDAQGNFSFGVVSAGDYVIRVKAAVTASPRQVGGSVNPAAPGASTKSFFESRSNTAKAGGANPLRVQVVVNGGSGVAATTRTMQADAAQEMQVSTAGGPLAGRITVQ